MEEKAVAQKSILTSKTVSCNLLLASAMELHPQIKQWVGAHPDTIVLLYTAMNVVLRHFTDTSVYWMKKK